MGDNVIITGGWGEAKDKVSKYGLAGHLYDLPLLLEGRNNHGCGGYHRQDGAQVCIICVGGVCVYTTEFR